MDIDYQGRKLTLEVYPDESTSVVKEKLRFVEKLEKADYKPSLVNKYTKLFTNMKFKNCKYSDEIMEKINTVCNMV